MISYSIFYKHVQYQSISICKFLSNDFNFSSFSLLRTHSCIYFSNPRYKPRTLYLQSTQTIDELLWEKSGFFVHKDWPKSYSIYCSTAVCIYMRVYSIYPGEDDLFATKFIFEHTLVNIAYVRFSLRMIHKMNSSPRFCSVFPYFSPMSSRTEYVLWRSMIVKWTQNKNRGTYDLPELLFLF